MHEKLLPYLPDADKPRTAYYIGVEKDPAVVAKFLFNELFYSKREPPRFDIYLGNAYEDVALFIKQGRRWGAGNFDTTQAGTPKWWDTYGPSMLNIVNAASEHCPQVVIILNHTLDRGYEPGVDLLSRMVTQAENIARTFKSWNLPLEALTRGMKEFAARPTILKDLRKNEELRAGGAAVYKSANHRLRMMTFRFVFNSKPGSPRSVYVDR
jgi:hypothetical protein